ncbi:MAG: LacI family transcriptional regulator [Spirochaetales bacterium]|jgi:LacI family transcriptional regulator|nr:LacI family transcriptional regulator [Spirochaetales bacterium]
MHSVTIKDIAGKIGVSYSSVSRALGGKPGVRDDVRQKVLMQARDMGYFPNTLARSLVLRRSLSIGLVVPDITNPFFSEVARGAAARSKESDYAIILCDTHYDLRQEQQYCRMLFEKRVDGIVIAPVTSAIEAELEQYRFPVVYINAVPSICRSYVNLNHVHGAFLATRHLFDAGYRRVACLLGDRMMASSKQSRLFGYKQALAECGRNPSEERILHADTDLKSYPAIIEQALDGDRGFDAVFCTNDVLALNLLQTARQMCIDVPGRLGIVGFDGIPFTAYPGVNLSTIVYPKYQMGHEAVRICLEEIGGAFIAGSSFKNKTGGAKAVSALTLDCTLEARETSRGPAVKPVI